MGLSQAVAILISSFLLALGSLRSAKKLHAALLYNVLRSPMSFFDTTPLGRIVNRFSKDIDTVDLAIPQTLRSWIMCFLQVIYIYIYMIFTLLIPLLIFPLKQIPTNSPN